MHFGINAGFRGSASGVFLILGRVGVDASVVSTLRREFSLVGFRRWRNRFRIRWTCGTPLTGRFDAKPQIASKCVLLFPVRREVGHPKQWGSSILRGSAD